MHIPDLSVRSGWHADFEDGFCGYQAAWGYCYEAEGAGYRLVRSPARSGRFAAAFTIDTESDADQTRCARRGIFPREAYYGAWFLIPSGTTSSTLWNLIHFQGAKDGDLSGLWDISISMGEDGALRPEVFDHFSGSFIAAAPEVVLPTDEWFHVQFFLKRDRESSGAIALYLNGIRVIAREGITTDDSDWMQWYVGNLAYALTPSESTVYVDDVSITETLDAR